MKLTPGVLLILCSALLFAVMNVGVKAIPRVPVHEIVFFRALTTLVLAYLLLRIKGISVWGNHRPLLILRGLAGTVALVLYFWTVQNMPLATAVTVQHLSPIFTILLSALMLREPPRPIQVPFFVIAFAGVVLVKGLDPAVTVTELALGVTSACFSGLAYNMIRMLREHDRPLVVVFYFPLVTVPLIGPYTFTHWHQPTPWEWALLACVGLTSTGAQICMTQAYQVDRASNISIVNYLGILFALLFGLLIFHETPGPLALLGVVLITLGVALATRHGRQPQESPGTEEEEDTSAH